MQVNGIQIGGIIVTGHPGLAPLLWWLIGFGVALQLFVLTTMAMRYRRLRPQTSEAKAAILLPSVGHLYVSTALLFGLLALQLQALGQLPLEWSLLALPVVLFGIVVAVVLS